MVDKDKLNKAANTIQQMRNMLRSVDDAGEVIDLIGGAAQTHADLEKGVKRLKKELEDATVKGNAAKVAALKEQEAYNDAVKELCEKWAKEVEYQKDKAAKEISEIADRVNKFREEEERLISVWKNQKALLKEAIVEETEKLKALKDEIERIKAKLE
jgi:hypothetical protein